MHHTALSALSEYPVETSVGSDKVEGTSSVVAWTLDRFADQRMVLTTGFGMEGCALIEMYARHQKPLDIIYLDTGFFFPETHRLIDQMRSRYPHLSFINRGTQLDPEEQARHFGDELWKKDPDLCCRLRKVHPLRRALQDVDVWITAVTGSQSAHRAKFKAAQWSSNYEVLRICPLIDWSRKEVWEFVQSNNVPHNELHLQGYPSIGCTHCTKAVSGLSVDGYSRQGRWAGTDKTECGLHS